MPLLSQHTLGWPTLWAQSSAMGVVWLNNEEDVLKIKVKDLQVGDRLEPTSRMVTHAPTAGLSTPSGKMDLGLDGKSVQFGKHTLVHITRKDLC